jgi:hypothetical protein
LLKILSMLLIFVVFSSFCSMSNDIDKLEDKFWLLDLLIFLKILKKGLVLTKSS